MIARTLAVLLALGILAAAGGAAFVASGIYDVSATEQHLKPVYGLLEATMRRSVQHHAQRIGTPALDDPAQIERGLVIYRDECARCHGAPGVAPEPFALGLNPAPANLAHTARTWQPREVYWVVRYGIKTTGMPAWQHRLSDDDMWAVVAFVRVMPTLSAAEYAERAKAAPTTPPVAVPPAAAGTTATERGARAMQQYACTTCHVIPGITGAHVPVGPPLDAMAERGYIGGVLPNTPANMVRWLRSPPAVNPRTLMPDLGVTAQDAADMAAYLHGLR